MRSIRTGRWRSRYLGILVLLAGINLSAGCAGAAPIASGDHPEVRLSAWTAYWDDQAGQQEYKQLHRKLASVSCFAASYDSNDQLVVPDETRQQVKLMSGKNKTYLTVVNDSQDKKGRTVEKDKELLKRLLADDDAMDHQVESILAMAADLNCKGVELDYEAFWKDAKLRSSYLQFTYRLSLACEQAGVPLRIVLEPSAPMDAGFCKGPTYVVMLYNLYGKHSGPGPKADGSFIQKTIKKMEALPGDKAVAIATGGCLWEDYGLLGLKSGRRQFLSQAEAVALRKKHKAVETRDPESADLHYSFDDNGKKTEVWYADAETLNAWITVAADAGVTDVSIWRLGGNEDIRDIRTH